MHTGDLGDFAAIGSGKPWAQAIFRPHLRVERDLQLGKIFAYRVLADSIALAAGYLCEPIHIYVISSNGDVSKVGNGELQRLAETCEAWRELEREAVGSLLAPNTAQEPESEIPKPEE